MATQVKLTIKRGQAQKDIVQAAGTVIAGGDAMELNIDTNAITKAEAAVMIDELRNLVMAGPWPRT